MYPNSLQKLIEELKKLPGVGNKSAERFALDILERKDQDIEPLVNALIDVHQNIIQCNVCAHYSQAETCDICSNPQRDHSIICVVASPKDVIAIERSGQYQGVYHVLHGVISTMKGILPSDINVENLIKRCDDSVKEVIVATNPNVEGETTAMYISKRLKDNVCDVTRLASGLPMGGLLDYIDDLTLMKAIEGRKKI
jgi:recombination protein RecR